MSLQLAWAGGAAAHQGRDGAAFLQVPACVLEACTTWDVPAGRTLLHPGSVGDVCYGVRSGMVDLLREGTLLDVLEPGQWIGIDLAVAGFAFGAQTVSPASLFVLRRSRLLALVESQPAVRAWLLAAATQRIGRIAERLHVLTACDADERARWAIALLAQRFAAGGSEAQAPGLRLSQSELARIANTSRQSLNKAVARRRRQGAAGHEPFPITTKETPA